MQLDWSVAVYVSSSDLTKSPPPMASNIMQGKTDTKIKVLNLKSYNIVYFLSFLILKGIILFHGPFSKLASLVFPALAICAPIFLSTYFLHLPPQKTFFQEESWLCFVCKCFSTLVLSSPTVLYLYLHSKKVSLPISPIQNMGVLGPHLLCFLLFPKM